MNFSRQNSPDKSRAKNSSQMFSSLKSRYIQSLNDDNNKSPASSSSKESEDSPEKELKKSPAKEYRETPSRTSQKKAESVKKIDGKINFLTDLEINSNIQTIMNNSTILKNLLVSVASSVKVTKNELQGLTEGSKQNNADIQDLVKALQTSQEAYKELEKKLGKASEKEQDKKFENIIETLSSLQSSVGELKPSGIPEAQQTEMTYNIVKSNRAEALAILKEIDEWKIKQDKQFSQLNAKIASMSRADSAQSGFLLLNNIGQILNEQLHSSYGAVKPALNNLGQKVDSIMEKMEENGGGLKGNDLADLLDNTVELKQLNKLEKLDKLDKLERLEKLGKYQIGQLEHVNEQNETVLNTISRQQEHIDSLEKNFSKEVNTLFREGILNNANEALLNERIQQWTNHVDKNMSQLLIGTLTSKFQGVLTDTIKRSLEENSQKYFSQPEGSRSSRSSNDELISENRRLKRRLAELEESSEIGEAVDSLKAKVRVLEKKKQTLQGEYSYLKEAYTAKYREYESLERKYEKKLNAGGNRDPLTPIKNGRRVRRREEKEN